MPASSTPQLSYQVIPIPDRSPVVLLGLDVAPPEPVEIVLVVDLSDSCGDLSSLVSYTRKLLAQLPADWTLQIFRLSSPVAISRPDLCLHDLTEASDWFGELCVNKDMHLVAARSGSFLRPVLENLQSVESPYSRLVLVLTDGQFSDFGQVEVQSDVEIVAITQHSSNADSRSRKPIQKQIRTLPMQDPQLDRVIARFTHPFFGPVVIEPETNMTDDDRYYRVDADGRLTGWSRMPNHIVNLASGTQFILFNGTLEESQAIEWKLKSCSSSSQQLVRGSKSFQSSQRTLEKRIIHHFTQAISGTDSDAICWSGRDELKFASLFTDFQKATELSKQGEAWVDDVGKMRVFSEVNDVPIVADKGQSQHHAILAVAVVCPETNEALHVGLFSLHRDQSPTWQIQPGSSLNGLTTHGMISIQFDPNRYRWIMTEKQSEGRAQELITELAYYESESINIDLSHLDGDVKVLFSGNLS